MPKSTSRKGAVAPQRLALPSDAEGFAILAAMATLPGEQLYRAFGFREAGRTMLPMPDGVAVEGVAMQRAIARGSRGRAPAGRNGA